MSNVKMTVQREPSLFVRLELRDSPEFHWDVAVVPRIDCTECQGRGVAFIAGTCLNCHYSYYVTFCLTTLPVTRGNDFVIAGDLLLCGMCRELHADDLPRDLRVPNGGKLKV